MRLVDEGINRLLCLVVHAQRRQVEAARLFVE